MRITDTTSITNPKMTAVEPKEVFNILYEKKIIKRARITSNIIIIFLVTPYGFFSPLILIREGVC